MIRLVLTASVLLTTAFTLSAFASTGEAPPIPWRDPSLASDRRIGEPSVSGILRGERGPKPERGFDDELGEVVGVGLSASEEAYLEKKPSEAFLRSAVLPGWGQRYGERPVRGAIYSALEAGLWAGLLLSRQSWVEGVSDYETFARQHAQVSGDRPHQYYVDIGNYDNTDEFNEAQRRKREYGNQYRNPSDYWEWDDSMNRERFEDVRISADRAKNRVYYFLGGLVLNRIVSAIDASRGLASKQDDLRDRHPRLSLGFNPTTRAPSLVLTW